MPIIKKTPRPYQAEVINGVYTSWGAGFKAPLVIMPTGAGKTFVFTYITGEHWEQGGTIMISCHRAELIQQISMSLAGEGIEHDFICADADRTICTNMHQREFGRSYYRLGARVLVCSVQTLASRLKDPNKKLATDSAKYIQQKQMQAITFRQLETVTLAVFDEAHHLLRDNIFGVSLKFLRTTTRYLLVTATPHRADGKGLGDEEREGMGIADCIVRGPEMRWLIEQGNLCEYDLYEPPTEQADMSNVSITAGGDYNLSQQSEAMRAKEGITGDAVKHYKSIINGKLTIVFCCDIKHAESVCEKYNAAGIPSAVLHGGNDPRTRFKTIEAFRNRQILVLVTVDLVSEGFDLPAIEAAQFLRKTASLSWWMQAFGRVLRPLEGKGNAIILDHVGNWRDEKLGLPDRPREWSLASRRGGGSKEAASEDYMPSTRCRATVNRESSAPEFAGLLPSQIGTTLVDDKTKVCGAVYTIDKKCCPKCGQTQPIVERGQPVMHGGNLVIVAKEVLDQMRAGSFINDQHAIWRAEIQQDLKHLMMTPEQYVLTVLRLPPNSMYVTVQLRNHRNWIAVRNLVKPLMEEWLEYHRLADIGQEATQELFLKRFGINVYHAQVLKPKAGEELAAKLRAHLEAIHEKGGLTYV